MALAALVSLLSCNKFQANSMQASSPDLKFLFVGNSISYWNELQDRFEKIVACNGTPDVEAACYCFPGISVEDLTVFDLDSTSGVTIREKVSQGESPELFKRYISQKWNGVFVQDRDNEPNEKRRTAIKKIRDGIGNSRMFLFQNYSNILFDEDLNGEEVNDWSSQNSTYCQDFSIAVVPVGNFFKYSFFKNRIRLIDEDGHPNELGTDAIALLYFYSYFMEFPKSSCLEKLNFEPLLIIDVQDFYKKYY